MFGGITTGAVALMALFTIAVVATAPSRYTSTLCPIRLEPTIVAVVLRPMFVQFVGLTEIIAQ